MPEMTNEDWNYFTIQEFFKRREFECKHCGECHMDYVFMKDLLVARRLAAVPFIITSGYRCPDYDKAIGGAGNHPTGKAADILTPSSNARFRILDGLITAGFARIGIGKTFTHVDALDNPPENKVQEVIWLYD